jgi:hypothetical protein
MGSDSGKKVDAAEKDAGSGKLGYKVMASVGAALSANVARKVLTTSWKKATGKEPPAHPEHPDQGLAEAISWAAASAGVIAAARVLAQRRVAQTWRRASGELPPGIPDDPDGV